jgi:Helicase associated domain
VCPGGMKKLASSLGDGFIRSAVKERGCPLHAGGAIKFVWDPYEDAWLRGFATLKQFKTREKHCRVPRGHLEGAYNLGTWVVNQRNRRDTLSVQRRQRLDTIGFVWRLT